MKRYPCRGKVSTNRGFSAESSNASRKRFRRVQTMVEVNEGIGGPQFAAQFLPSDYLARVSKRANKNSEGLLLQLDLYAVLAQFAGAQVEFEKTKANRSR